MKKIQIKNPQYFHREMWLWLAQHPDKDKTDWPRWETYIPYQTSYCFACECARTEYARYIKRTTSKVRFLMASHFKDRSCNHYCYFCPIVSFREKALLESRGCFARGELFKRWSTGGLSLASKAVLAEKIANLQWSFDYEEGIKHLNSLGENS